jgi:hypothetical protein
MKVHARKYGLAALLAAAALALASCGGGSAGGGAQGGHEGMDHGSMEHGSGVEDSNGGHGTGQDHSEMGHGEGASHGGHGAGHDSGTMSASEVSPEEAGVEVALESEPETPEPGASVRLSYRVTDAGSGEALTKLPVDHERQMHLIVVSKDLTDFRHIHPEPRAGAFSVSTRFDEPGTYVLFDEFVRGDGKVLDRRELEVGTGGGEAALTPDASEPKKMGGLTVALEAPGEIQAGKEAAFTYTLTKEDGAPADDLEPYLGAPAHIAIVSEDTRRFAHTHGEPVNGAPGSGEGSGGHEHGEDGEHAGHGGEGETFGPKIGFAHTFEEPGLYKVWAEFNHHGDVVAVPFVVEVV